MKQCKKCLINKSIESFDTFSAVTEDGKVRKVRNVCHECCYKKRKTSCFRWKTATDKEKLKWIEKQFNKQVIKKGKNECWDWNGFIRPDGYTRIKFGSRTTSVGGHVVSWMIKHNRIIKAGENILHKCDNRKCTNPKHLYLGSYSDNMVDMVTRNRHPGIKLSISNVKKIKKLLLIGAAIVDLASMFKVKWGTIYDIKHNKTWKHVK